MKSFSSRRFQKTIPAGLVLAAVLLPLTVWADDTLYEIGPGKPYAHIYDVPTHNLQPGDILRVYAKAEPYREKFLLHGVGTPDKPILLLGVPDAAGNKPVLDGQGAVSGTAKGNYFWNEDRGIIKVGQYTPQKSDHIIIDGFELRNAQRNNTFVDDTGVTRFYGSNAAGVFVEHGDHVTIRNCFIHDNGNGIQTTLVYNLLIEHAHIYNNGAGSSTSAYEHNLYLSGGPGTNATVQFCRFGDLLNDGQQIKFRTETTVIRYNWIEGGKNSQIDLVEDSRNGVSDAFVYGNVIIKPAATNNGRLIHFGQDGGTHVSGVLHFFHNTIINRAGRTVYLFRLSSSNRTAQVHGNIFHKENTSPVYLCGDAAMLGRISGSANWFHTGTNELGALLTNHLGTNPGFANPGAGDYHPTADAPVVNQAVGFVLPMGHAPDLEYVPHLGAQVRPTFGPLDLGAYEYAPEDPTCTVDLDQDGDADGEDLARFCLQYDGDCLSEMAESFGR